MCGQICKPSSVIEGNYLSRPQVALRLKPPVGLSRASLTPVGVAPNRVYMVTASSFLPTGELLPRLSTLTANAAVYLCCTVPKVTLGGR